ncbi:WXG100 family type VII secretion target [Kineococcus glutinatus]|uniref:ESAT-6-like protein n=1 Tax=Kineococcus glutinatus TaxID=1070872 RepID=A0ABP9I9K7_9ACTN
MANVNVTYDEMRGAADQLTNGQHEIEGQLQRLKALVNDLVASGYVTDRSSKAFQASYEQFDAGVKQTVAGLTGMSSYLKGAAQALEDTDVQLAAQLG